MIAWGGVSWRGQAYEFEPMAGVGIPRRGARDEHHVVRGEIVIDQPLCNFADLASSAFTASISGTFLQTWIGDSLRGFGTSHQKLIAVPSTVRCI